MAKLKPKALLLLLLVFEVAFAQQVAQRLPDELSEDETHQIAKEDRPKSHVEATFRVSNARLAQALQLARDSQFRETAQNIDLYTALITYADSYARRATTERSKDRYQCLKMIEQQIFKQYQTLDSLVKELPYTYRDNGERATTTAKRLRLRAIDDLLGGGSVLKSANDTPQ